METVDLLGIWTLVTTLVMFGFFAYDPDAFMDKE